MIMVGAAAVPEVQLAEGTQSQIMAVVNARFGGVQHQEAALQPAIAELAILSGDQRPVLIEAAQLLKPIGGKGKVTCGKKMCPTLLRIVVVVNGVDDYLSGR